MCGIAGGMWYRPELSMDRTQLRAMTDCIAHRGPDDVGYYFYNSNDSATAYRVGLPSVALGFRRLSIIDLAGGHQPIGNEDGSIQIVFNGEIYNYRELRHRLEANGHRFATDSDTEVIVHLYEDLGIECFAKLNGMFAIAIWDSREKQLVLARDRMGKKPLYYAKQPGRLLFGSELKSICSVSGFNRTIDPSAIDHYLTYQYIPHPYSIYESAKKLPPGHVAVYRQDSSESKLLDTQSFWNIDWTREIERTKSQAIEEVRELFTDAVKIRLRSDVPLGAFLSGGVDSSLVVAVASKLVKEPIRTFAIGFSDADFDETRYAKQVADFLHTSHNRFEVNADALQILDKLAYHYDEPFSDSSAVPTWYLCQQTRSQVTVALSGDGGDELFAGYERYKALAISETIQRLMPLHKIVRNSWLSTWRESPNRRSFIRRLKRFSEALGEPPARRYMRWIQIFQESMRSEMYQDDFLQSLPNRDPFEFLEKAWNSAGKDRDLISKATVADMQTYLPCDLMTKVDIASMAHSLEARQPFLDYRLIEFAASLPSRFKYRHRKGKRLLKDAFEREIPANIWNRPKMGFGIPIGSWFRGPLKDRTREMILSEESRIHRYLKPDVIRRIYEQHQSGTSNEGYRLWNLLMLELWMRRWT